ncbi:MAG: hypothetical protein HOP29_02970 [Phycisphaerales bacterium]|nr:hypothetical protein [Phycisphaerales bacterium]
MGGHGAEDIAKHVRVYVTVFAALLVLTIVTVGVAQFHLPIRTAVALAMLIALIKGSLVACYFMHLISEKSIIYWVLTLTVLFFVFLMLLPVLDVGGSTGSPL